MLPNTIIKIFKEYGLLVLSVGALVAISALASVKMDNMAASGGDIYYKNFKDMEHISEVSLSFEQQAAIVYGVPAQLDLAMLATDKERFEKGAAELITLLGKSGGMDKLIADVNAFVEDSEPVFAYAQDFAQAQASEHLTATVTPAAEKVKADIEELSLEIEKTAEMNVMSLQNEAASTRMQMIIITLALVFIVVVLGAYMAWRSKQEKRATDRVIQDVLSVLSEVITSSDNMKKNSSTMVEQARRTSERVSSVASATEQASASMQSISAAIEELSATADSINTHATGSQTISQSALEASGRATNLAGEMKTAIEQVANVLGMIRDIADQTNLLALNAAIESARAGDAGKGFAVVADEVRKLSGETNNSTARIEEQIEKINSSSEQVFSAIRNTNETIEQISSTSQQICSGMQEQSDVTRDVTGSIGEITGASSQINKDMVEVSDIAASVEKASQQTLELAEDLFAKSNDLQEKLSTFLATK